jgi:uncharacterized paraquat-inducible protein A
LKENAEAFAHCLSEADEQTVEARDESDRPRRDDEEKVRKCLICKSPFPSGWAGERICRRCKSTSAWRSGALG